MMFCGSNNPASYSRMMSKASVLCALLIISPACFAAYGLRSRPQARPYLQMPEGADGKLPERLSQTGAFRNIQNLSPAEALIPYNLNLAFWSDGAHKMRWASIPDNGPASDRAIHFSAAGEWVFPKGSVFVKHFEISLDETHPEQRRRLETRFLICDSTGSVYGVTYKWRSDNSDADLLATNLTELLLIKTASGVRTQAWYYPSRQDCRTCHTDLAGGVLGVRTRQMNCDFSYPSGVTDNQLRTWNHLGLFRPAIQESDIPRFPALSRIDDESRSIEDRARSYLDANCSHCHRPQGTVATFDSRFDTPLREQNLVAGPVLIDQGVDKALAIAPNDPCSIRSRQSGCLRWPIASGMSKGPPLSAPGS
jgi:hypothetical protein